MQVLVERARGSRIQAEQVGENPQTRMKAELALGW